jgi:hypothetical protein
MISSTSNVGTFSIKSCVFSAQLHSSVAIAQKQPQATPEQMNMAVFQ